MSSSILTDHTPIPGGYTVDERSWGGCVARTKLVKVLIGEYQGEREEGGAREGWEGVLPDRGMLLNNIHERGRTRRD